jgi:hypothetical protein
MAKQTYTAGQVLTAAEMTTLQANDYNQTVSAKVASYVLAAADAGTTITMNNVGATTITVNTALFTAGDTLKILNIGAGVCTITAGTATVSSSNPLALNQYDNGILYFTSTGVSIFTSEGSAATLTATQTLTNKTLTSPAIIGSAVPTGNTGIGSDIAGTGGSLYLYGNNATSRMRILSAGPTVIQGGFAPTTGISFKTANFTQTLSDTFIRCTGTASITATLLGPSAGLGVTNYGLTIYISTTAAFSVVSASANITQKTGGAATTAILPATAGAWAILVLESTVSGWVIVASGT